MDTHMDVVDSPNQKVKDVYLAAYFHCLGYTLSRIENTRPHSNFYFGGVAEGKEFDYYNAVDEFISPREFFDSFKTMRSLSSHIEFMPDDLLGVRDIYFVSYLYYKEYKIERIDPTNFQYRFIFRDVPMDVILRFYNRGAEQIQVKKLMQAFRAVRDLAAYKD